MDAEDYQRHVAMNDICGRRGGLWGEGEWTNLEDQQWTKWLEKVSEGLVVLQKDQNGKVISTVVDMRVKMCPKYLEEGPITLLALVRDGIFVKGSLKVIAEVDVAVLMTSMMRVTETR